jgi:hypothetical protein
MIRLVLLTILVFYNSIAFGCQCARGFGHNFLNQVKNFDLVVLGKFHIKEQTGEITLAVEKIYKGEIKSQIIRLIRGGTDCNHWMDFKNGTRIIIGLNNSPYGGQLESFIAFGCITSSLLLTNKNIVKADRDSFFPAIKPQRIGSLKKMMKLRTLERRISRKVK